MSGSSYKSWDEQVVQPTVNLTRSFRNENEDVAPDWRVQHHSQLNALDRDLWTQYIRKKNYFRHVIRCLGEDMNGNSISLAEGIENELHGLRSSMVTYFQLLSI